MWLRDGYGMDDVLGPCCRGGDRWRAAGRAFHGSGNWIIRIGGKQCEDGRGGDCDTEFFLTGIAAAVVAAVVSGAVVMWMICHGGNNTTSLL